MPINKNAQLRHNILIRMMREGGYPNYPKIKAELRRLDPAGAEPKISAKTIQRDVVYLNDVFFGDSIKYNYEERGYYLSNPYKDNYVQNMDEREVDAVMFGAHFAEALIPQIKLTGELRFGSDKVLGRNPPSEPDTVTLNSMIAHGSRLKILPDVFQTVFEAWQRHNLLALNYRRGGDGKIQELRIAPHMIAYFENVWYLRAEILQCGSFKPTERTFWTLAMHRIQPLNYHSLLFADYKYRNRLRSGFDTVAPNESASYCNSRGYISSHKD